MKNLINSFIVVLTLLILAVPLRSQDCMSQSQVVIVDNDTTLLTIVVENVLNDTLGQNGQALCGVNINFQHEYVGDLLVELIAPNGDVIVLMGPPTTNSSITDLITWDVSFVPCSFVASPDADFDDVWNNFNNWAILSQYDGSYYPFFGCLEDFNGGAVNGSWTLRINDISLLGEGAIESFELIFCDPTGIDCFECSPNGGTIAPQEIAFCEGDPNLLIPFNPDFNNNIPDPDVYDYLNIISSNNVLVEYTDQVDLTSYDPGIYEVCGISILEEVVDDLPTIDGIISLDSVQHQIALGLLCAEMTLGCFAVEVYNVPDTVFIQDTICMGASYQVGTESFTAEDIHEVTLFNGQCDSTVVLDLEVIVIDALIDASIGSISCSDDFLTLDGTGSTLDANTTILWSTSDGVISTDPSQLIIEITTSGLYTLTLEDSGCMQSASVVITSNEEMPEINFNPPDVLDCQTDSIQIEITVPGNITDFLWDGPNGFTSPLQNPFVYEEGTYIISVTNNFGCSGMDSIMITHDNLLDIPSFTFGILTCDNLQTQIVTDIANEQNYTYSWSGLGGAFSSMEQSPVVTEPGIYSLGVEGLNGCIENYEIEVLENIEIPDFSITVDTVLCTNPTATIQIEAPANSIIEWDDASFGNDFIISVQNEGQYDFELTAENGCKLDSFATVIVDTLIPILNLTDSLEINCVDSILTINSYQNVDLNSTFSWIGPFGFESTLPNPFVYDQGIYNVVVTNDNGCERSGSIEIILGEDEPEFIFQSDTIDCNNTAVDILASPDATGYSFNWNGPDDFDSMDPSPNVDMGGRYTVTVTDDNTGCTARYEIGVESELVPVEIDLEGGVLGCLMEPVEISYSVEDFVVMTASWSGPNYQFEGDTAFVFEEGLYYIDLLGVNGCSYTDSIEIMINIDAPILTVQDTFIGCGQSGINLEVQSSLDVDTYQWSGPGFTSTEENPMASDIGQYEVTVTAINGCENTASILVSEDTNLPDIDIVGSLEINCINTSTEITISSSTEIIDYVWSGPQVVGNQSSAMITEVGEYTVVITASNFCTNEITFTIEQTGIPPQFDTAILDISCATNESGAFIITTTDNISSYEWSGPNGFMGLGSSIQVVDPGEYSVTVTGGNGCVAEESYVIESFITPPEVINIIDGVVNCITSNVIIGVETSTTMEFYNWSGPNGFTSQDNFPLVNLDGVYVVELIDSFGCSFYQDVEVEIDTISPILEAFGSAINCLENKVELSFETNETNFTFIWSGPNNFSSEELMPVVDIPGEYTITLVGPNGCSSFETYIVGEDLSGPDIEAFDASLPCNTDPVVLQVSSSTENVDFIWFGPNGFISEMQNPDATDIGEYIIVATGPNGCISRDTIMVDDNPVLPVFEFSTGEISCINPEVKLKALFVNDDASVEWSGPDMFSSFEEEVIVDQGGIYELIVEGLNGCIDTALVEVAVDTIAPIAIAITDNTLKCNVEQIRLDGTNSDNGPFYQPFWFTNDGNFINGESTFIPLINKPGMYYLQVQDSRNGCIGIDSILIEEAPNSLEEMLLEIVEPLCFGLTNGSVHIDQTIGGEAPYTYSLDGGFYSSIQDFYLLSPGEHILSVQDSSGCTLDTSILIPNGHELVVDLGPDTLINLGETLDISALLNVDPSEVSEVRWLPTPDDACINCLNISVSPTQTTQYDIRVEDQNGCVAEDFIIVRVKDESPLYIPNIYSPNNDNNNDHFMIFGGESVEQIDYINILDRWGNIVFEAFEFQPQDASIRWDGIYRGKPLQPAVFSYIIGYTMLNGVERQEAGTITLVR